VVQATDADAGRCTVAWGNTNTSDERSEATMAETHEPGPEIDAEDEDKVLDDLDPDEAEAAGIKGGRHFNYGDGPVTRK
jgi:hypothetical protein